MKHEPLEFDAAVRTDLLKRTIARAVTPRALERVHDLRKFEGLLAAVVERRPIGVQGCLLNGLCSAYPVNKRAMELELCGRGPQGLVEAAEQIELKLWGKKRLSSGQVQANFTSNGMPLGECRIK